MSGYSSGGSRIFVRGCSLFSSVPLPFPSSLPFPFLYPSLPLPSHPLSSPPLTSPPSPLPFPCPARGSDERCELSRPPNGLCRDHCSHYRCYCSTVRSLQDKTPVVRLDWRTSASDKCQGQAKFGHKLFRHILLNDDVHCTGMSIVIPDVSK